MNADLHWSKVALLLPKDPLRTKFSRSTRRSRTLPSSLLLDRDGSISLIFARLVFT